MADLMRRALLKRRHVTPDIRDLELIRKAGIEGLEPVFELFESALA